MIFSLPFHLARFFRPTFLEVFSLNNAELGDVFGLYGLVALLSYIPGGLIADRFVPTRLMAVSLLVTALGGIYLYTIPSLLGLKLLFGYWGVTTILLFWSALIKTTRLWGNVKTQGLAFGFLDGGRGLVASLFASIAVFIFSIWANLELHEPRKGLQMVIGFYTLMTLIVSYLVWCLLPSDTEGFLAARPRTTTHPSMKQRIAVLKDLNVWIQGGIIISAYCGFRALDNYGVYAVQVLGMSQIESAKFTTMASYLRPVAAVAAGLIVYRIGACRTISIFISVLLLSFLMLGQASPGYTVLGWLMANLLITFVAVYALRGVYFALLEESNLHINSTGTAVGVISLMGFTPDVFFAPITGRILDANPGFVGFQHYFFLLAAIALIGLFLSIILFRRLAKK